MIQIIAIIVILTMLCCKYEHFVTPNIPKIMYRSSHFTLDNMPPVVKGILVQSQELNPDYQLQYYDDADCVNFIQKYYPEYYWHYQKLAPSAYKSDLWRLLVLYHYGGVYNDIGHQYMLPLSQILRDDDELVLAYENNDFTGKFYVLHNAFIAVYPRHPLISNVIKEVAKNIETENYGIDAIDITSCRPLGREFNKFFGRNAEDSIFEGTYTYKDYKARVFKFVCCDRIEDTTGMPIIKTKFDDYYNVMYGKEREGLSYKLAWQEHRVFVQ